MSIIIDEVLKVKDGRTFIENEYMQEIAGEYADGIEEYVYNKVTDTSRWSTHYEQVFKLNGKYYQTYYSEGSTEMQDEAPYEYEGEWVEVTEVVPKEVTVTKYVTKEGR